MEANFFNEIKAQLLRIEELTLAGIKAVLNITEASQFTGISKAQLYRLTSEKRIPHYKKNNKLYFKKTELENWMLQNKVETIDEINSRASTYLYKKRNNANL